MMKIIKKTNMTKLSLNFIQAIILIFSVILSGCSPSSGDQSPPANTVEENTPTPLATQAIQNGEYYTPNGQSPEGRLLVYSDHSLDSQTIGEISLGATGISISESFTDGSIPWVKVEYDQLTGWVDYSFLASYKGDLPEELIKLSHRILNILKDTDFENLDEYIHPELCLRISPYPYLADNNLSFCPGEIQPLWTSDESYIWGHFDGTGEPIDMTFSEYYRRFIYDVDFTQAPMIGLNVVISSGNAINNIPELFPDGMMIEYYFPGFDIKYGGMDWRSLRLVFVNIAGTWYLGAIIHGEWTI
jgi:hypothetical protein